MAKLEALASITRLSDHVVRVLGQNPGKFTLQGTNTYIIGRQNTYTLIDTGEGKEEYIPVLASALRDIAKPSAPTDPDVSDIILSHKHGDHIGGLPSVLALLRQLWEERNISKYFPLATEATLSSTPTIPSSLQVLHTPGHTADSIAIYVPSDDALYTADTVLGQGTAVFEDLASLISSLHKMHDFAESKGQKETKLYPGHGPVVEEGRELIEMYIQHRFEREEQIVRVLGSEEGSKVDPWTTWSIVTKIYAPYPRNLWLPAAHSINLHLKKLEKDGRVKHVGGEGIDSQWVLVKI
ncbi:hypothetical protein PILCRDRAFT_63579 [Piloderma croceum F 1598]|uniref:Metallo-beta-lactamase domain-containing protein n=1 Tax=Piloderma croceum (strain F 1598) TaxID=765440 RepID=A0A0C3G9W9_PILCF|nr:hypothetical protein PILCRDRAFT_63579 [Piloderma croceum F 1598]